MNLNSWDIKIIVGMFVAVVIMSFAFPAFGLTGDNVQESNIPEFNTSTDTFKLAGDFPQSPGSPTSGTLRYTEEIGSGVSGVSINWLDRPKAEGTSIELQNNTNEEPRIIFINWTSSGQTSAIDEYNITEEGQEILHDNDSWVIQFDVTKLENRNQSNMDIEVDWDIEDSPNQNEGGGLSAIPIVGTLFDTADFLASTLTYLGQIIFWGILTFVDLVIALIGIIVGVSVYLIEIMHFMITNYLSIIDGAPSGWIAVIVLLPGVILFVEFAKVVAILVNIIWIG